MNSVTASSFQIGYAFYYWDYYKSNPLYIERKYDSFKDEIREYECLSFENYQNVLAPKVVQEVQVNQLIV